jgi:hypothetical protein
MVKRIEAGLDPGGTGLLHRDKCALIIIQRVDSRIKVLFVIQWDKMNEEVFKEIGRLCTDYKVSILKIDDAQDYKEDLSNYFDKDKIYPVNFRIYKDTMTGQANRKWERELYEIKDTETDLLLQCKMYKKGGRPHADDLVDALMLATFWDDTLFKSRTHGRVYFDDTKVDPELANVRVDRLGFKVKEEPIKNTEVKTLKYNDRTMWLCPTCNKENLLLYDDEYHNCIGKHCTFKIKFPKSEPNTDSTREHSNCRVCGSLMTSDEYKKNNGLCPYHKEGGSKPY